MIGRSCAKCRKSFLLTPLREGRLAQVFLCPRRLGLISTHAPAGGATFPPKLVTDAVRTFLLTPLREGRLWPSSTMKSGGVISTHAPAGGATKYSCAAVTSLSISTHAPAGGATLYNFIEFGPTCHFYSRPCGRGDTALSGGTDVCFCISTHAPAGGATGRTNR